MARAADRSRLAPSSRWGSCAPWLRCIIATQLLTVSACTVYDPVPSEPRVAAPAFTGRVVRVCGEATEFANAEAELAGTQFFAAVKRCSEPFDESDMAALVSRPYYSDKDLFPSTLLMMILSAGVIPAIDCRHDLAFDLDPGGAVHPVKIDPKRTTCVMYGWLPTLLIPADAFHAGRTPDVNLAADALRAAMLRQWPPTTPTSTGGYRE